jgi:signal-transduction protein with cAMP-binding, CBS, and nucleotidyltransferase domain
MNHLKLAITSLLLAVTITSTQSIASTSLLQEELKQAPLHLQVIKQEIASLVPNEPSIKVFEVAENLSQQYQVLITKACNHAFANMEDITEDDVSVLLAGSIAWGEPTLQSDVEFVFLVKSYDKFAQIKMFIENLRTILTSFGDSYFQMDGASMVLDGPPMNWIVTPQDCFTLTFEEPEIISTKLQSYVPIFVNNYFEPSEAEEASGYIMGNLSRLSAELCGESLNLVHVGGNKALFDDYKDLRRSMHASFEYGERLNQLNDSKFINTLGLLNAVHTSNREEDYPKIYWRNISHVIRVLGSFFGCQENGSLKTLNFLKNKGVLELETYNDLLQKAQALTWVRLKMSTLEFDIEQIRDVIQKSGIEKKFMSTFLNEKLKWGTSKTF